MISAIFTHHQKPTISLKKIMESTKQMFKFMKQKNSKTYLSHPPNAFDVIQSIKMLDFKVIRKFDAKNTKH
jgi:hypothetical protein